MQNISIRKASELPDSVKVAVEALLGRALQAGEEVSVRAFPPHDAPSGKERATLARGLKARMDRTAQPVKGLPDGELEDILDEAMKHVRPAYRRRP